MRVITCRKIWIRISWLGSRSTWLFFIHAADVFSFQMSSVFPMLVQQILRSRKCPSSLHVFLLGEFAFRPTLKPPWRMHSLLSDLILASNPCCLTSSSSTHFLLLDVHFVDTVDRFEISPKGWKKRGNNFSRFRWCSFSVAICSEVQMMFTCQCSSEVTVFKCIFAASVFKGDKWSVTMI